MIDVARGFSPTSDSSHPSDWSTDQLSQWDIYRRGAIAEEFDTYHL